VAETHASPALQRAWELSYLDPAAAWALGREHATTGSGADAAEGWIVAALCEVRLHDAPAALQSLARARPACAALPDAAAAARGLALCDEVQAIVLRSAGDDEGSARLQADIDSRSGFEPDPMQRFVAHNSRAITARQQGHADAALRHFYAACNAALQTGWAGPRIAAYANLGGYHHDLYNLEDARLLSEQALEAAREAGATPALFASSANLIIIYYAAGDMQLARQMAAFLLAQPDEGQAGVRDRFVLPLALGHIAAGETDEALRYLHAVDPDSLRDAGSKVFWTWLMARCLMARNDAAGALAVAERTLHTCEQRGLVAPPFDVMSLHRVLADAAEAAGDAATALRYMRRAHAQYEHMVGRSARARVIALQVKHQLDEAQRERDAAVHGHRSAEVDRRRLSELNDALLTKVAETEMLHARLREQALRDPLTGLHNRRYLFEIVPGMLELARRHDRPLCVVLIDLDHFKLLNDTCGHAAGDLVLQRFSALLREMLRKSDVPCRHGGEEFVAVMPDIDAEGAHAMLTRLLDTFSALRLEHGRRRLPGGTFSAGIAVFPRHGSTLEQLLSRADRALYSAKHHGRARVEMAPRTGFATLG